MKESDESEREIRKGRKNDKKLLLDGGRECFVKIRGDTGQDFKSCLGTTGGPQHNHARHKVLF